MDHLLKLRDLHVLMTVAQARSKNKAAQLLSTTQPSVTTIVSARAIATLSQTPEALHRRKRR
jgi:hypothetical protein